jgi:hypothetical protein
MLRPNIGIEHPTRCHTSEVHSVKNYKLANIILGCLRANVWVRYVDKGKGRTDSE